MDRSAATGTERPFGRDLRLDLVILEGDLVARNDVSFDRTVLMGLLDPASA